ncbi:polysaccharide biosynthesis/export family protein [Mucilaginibacter aquaedulcis]|uniref:polysaccharide biosynthesis/export family protein n=1 Tax=Mucilaginibacter aquaedulcis TaxID=1187081 RepID=UPI0025B32E77|nr:polysaccharide biosynthesis/export family protein [Mucilaginibacter aquaedulcis]MDN3549863.1 polysaccharide biosynthesis/export family protein [Mucilaginibacter aquaedulcis]
MRLFTFTILFLGILFTLTSCSNKQYQSLFEQKGVAHDTLTQKSPAPDMVPYRIKSQDILQIRNLQNIRYIVDEAPSNGNNSGGGGSGGGGGQTYQVEDDSTVTLPVIGHVNVVGLTRAQAAKKVEDLYRKSLLKDPIIELKITNLKVTFLGEIKTQGNFPLVKDKTTLVDMIGAAGGLTDKANETNIQIIRGDQLNPQVTMINLRNIQSINDPRAILQNGDVIYISQNKRAVRNENLQNLSVITQPVLLLLNTALIIFTLSRR